MRRYLVIAAVVAVILCACSFVAGRFAWDYLMDRMVFLDCFPQYQSCSVEAACDAQRAWNADGYIVSGNYPGCPEPQDLSAMDDPLGIFR